MMSIAALADSKVSRQGIGLHDSVFVHGALRVCGLRCVVGEVFLRATSIEPAHAARMALLRLYTPHGRA